MKKGMIIIALSFLSLTSWAQKQAGDKKTKTATNAIPIEKGEMKTYFLVFLKKGPKRDQDSLTAGKIQAQHLAYLNKMYDGGKMDLAGPSSPDGEIRGFCVYNVASFDEAKKLAESDPAVVAGRLLVEVYPWYSQKGAMLR